MRWGTGEAGGRLRAVGVLLVTVLAWSLMPAPAASAQPAPDPGLSRASEARFGPPNRLERQWPRQLPWDACARPVWLGVPYSGAPGNGRRVLFVGDSLTRESRKRTTALLTRHGWTPTYRCWGSKRLDWGLAQLARAKQVDQLPDFVVMALGTNDISWETPGTTEHRIRAILDRIGPKRQVLWVDLHLTRSTWLNARAAWFNALLHRLEAERPNLTVVRWHQVAARHDIHGYDGIHYGPDGYALRARTVSAWLNRVGARI